MWLWNVMLVITWSKPSIWATSVSTHIAASTSELSKRSLPCRALLSSSTCTSRYTTMWCRTGGPMDSLYGNTLSHRHSTRDDLTQDATARPVSSSSSLNPASTRVSPASTCPPGGTQIPGNVLMCWALRVSNMLLSLVSSITTTPTSTPLSDISPGRLPASTLLMHCIGQKGGWVRRLVGHLSALSWVPKTSLFSFSSQVTFPQSPGNFKDFKMHSVNFALVGGSLHLCKYTRTLW